MVVSIVDSIRQQISQISRCLIVLNMLRKVRFILNRFTLEKMYFSFIRPILEYVDVVWDTQTHYLINKIENVHSEAARIVTGDTKLTSIIRRLTSVMVV
jgi:hypothetical protein